MGTTTLIYYLIKNCIKKMFGLGKKRLGLVEKKRFELFYFSHHFNKKKKQKLFLK
jgi:hypothetical protein